MPTVFFSEVQNKRVVGKGGERIGALADLLVRMTQETYPPLAGMIVRLPHKREVYVGAERLDHMSASGIKLGTSRISMAPFVRRDNELLLGRDLLDKQIVNVHGQKVVRVNDLQLEQKDKWRLAAADVSMAALAARLGLGRVLRRLKREVVPWEGVDLFSSDMPVGLSLRHEKLGKMHPADIADLLTELSLPQGQELLDSMDVETAADVLETMDPDQRTAALASMDSERAADLLEEMGPDEAADVLGDLPADTATELIGQMEKEEAEEVSSLMQHPENTAGGLMTTDYLSFAQDQTVGDVLEWLRREHDVPATHYLYVTDRPGAKGLRGVVSLWELVRSAPETKLDEIMNPHVQVLRVDDHVSEVARIMAHYNLLALPILGEDDQLVGIVTIDDAMEYLEPESWQTRIPKLFR